MRKKKITFIYPCIGRRVGESYIRSWQMEPLAPALLAGLTPPTVEVAFYDDRMEQIPYDEPTDLVAISVETYTAKRSYQIASLYRQRGVPVIMGGFHATLVADEVCHYADSVVVGEAETLWPEIVDDFLHNQLQPRYQQTARPSLHGLKLNRSIFAGKRYLPIGLIETGRGCCYHCEFCSIQSYYHSTQTRRPTEEVVAEIRQIKKPLIFIVDDNTTCNREAAKELFRALIPLKIRWVSQASIDVAHDEEILHLMTASGCQGVLIGFESLNPANLKQMHKGWSARNGGYEVALANLRRAGIRIYATFVMGYDGDTEATFRETVAFALRHRFYTAAFNHLLPFPGTPLYERLRQEGRLLFERWWLDPDYRYGMVPFMPKGMPADELSRRCVEARRAFFSFSSILKRSLDFQVNRKSFFMWSNLFAINLMIRREVLQRRDYPLGDESYRGPLDFST